MPDDHSPAQNTPSQWTEAPAGDVADAVVGAMTAGGVDHLFFTSGSEIGFYQEATSKAKAQGRKTLNLITVPLEHVSLNAALGFAAVSGRPAATACHVDCGTQHYGGAVHTAWRSGLPVIMTAGAPPTAYPGSIRGARNGAHLWSQQQWDQNSIVRQYVKWDKRLEYQDNPGLMVSRAIQVATSEPAGPVYMSFPQEIALMPLNGTRYPTVAQLGVARLQVEALKATYRQKIADNKSAEETVEYSQREYDRQKKLLGSGVSSQQQFDQASNALEVARQRVASTQQDIANVLAQLSGNPDIPINDHPMVQRVQAVLDGREIDLKDTVIRAPEDGTVTKVEQLQVGDYITAATPVFSLMSDRMWVEANFKETELTHMRPGQEATVEVDTYPGVEFHARVASLSPGTGLTFSLLPPENATGNWVKVVQRLPVRLTLDEISPDTPLHAGLSVTVNVDTKFRRPWLVMLERGYDRLFGTARAAETNQ